MDKKKEPYLLQLGANTNLLILNRKDWLCRLRWARVVTPSKSHANTPPTQAKTCSVQPSVQLHCSLLPLGTHCRYQPCVLVDLDPCSLVGGQIALPPFSPFQYKEKLWRFKKKQTSKTFFCKVNILIIMKMNNNKAVNTTSFLICITLSVLYLGN